MLPTFSCFATDFDAYIGKVQAAEKKELPDLKVQFAKTIREIPVITDDMVFDFDKAYKLYGFKEADIIALYRETGSIEEMVSDYYSWEFPTQNDAVVTMVYSGGKWEFSHLRSPDKSDPDPALRADVIKEKAVYGLIKADRRLFDDVKDFKYVSSGMYFTTFAYIKSRDKEYLIPYGTRPDLTGLVNGRVYMPDEAINILTKTFNYENNHDGRLNGGGSGSASSPSTHSQGTSFLVAICVLFGILTLSCGILLFRRRRRSVQR
jgi:hypothetical protein